MILQKEEEGRKLRKKLLKFLIKNDLFGTDISLISNILKNSAFSVTLPSDLLAYNTRKIAGETHINPVANFIKGLEKYSEKTKEEKDEILKNAQSMDNYLQMQSFNCKDSIYDLLSKDEIDKAIAALNDVIAKARGDKAIYSLDMIYIGRLEEGTHRGIDINDIKKNLLIKLLKLYCDDKGYNGKCKYIQTLFYILCYKNSNNMKEEKDYLIQCIKPANENGNNNARNLESDVKISINNIYHDYINKININEKILEGFNLELLYSSIKQESKNKAKYLSFSEIKKIVREKIEMVERGEIKDEKNLEKEGIYILNQNIIDVIQKQRKDIFEKKLLSIIKEYELGKIENQQFIRNATSYKFIIDHTFFKFISVRLPDNIKEIIKKTQLSKEIIDEISAYELIVNRVLNNKYFLTIIAFKPLYPYKYKFKDGHIKGTKRAEISPESLCRILVLVDLSKLPKNMCYCKK